MQLRLGSLFGTMALLASISASAQTTEPLNAVDDRALLGAGGQVTIPVLANDSGGSGRALTIQKVTRPRFGTAVKKSGGKDRNHPLVIVYTAGPLFSGFDSFQYTIIDDAGATSTATVTVHGSQSAIVGKIGALVTDRNEISVGYLELEGMRTGAFTGNVRISTKKYSIQGSLNRNGRYVGIAKSDDGDELPVSFVVTTSADEKLLTASFGDDDNWIVLQDLGRLSDADLDRLEGRYTVELPSPDGAISNPDSSDDSEDGEASGTDVPQGAGWMVVEVNDRGDARLKGRTGDGRSFAVDAQVMSEAGEAVLPFFEAWGASVLGGTLRLGEDSIEGSLTWKRDTTSDDRYPDGFDLKVDARGDRYEAPKNGRRALAGETSDGGRVTLTIRGGGIDEFTRELRFSEGDDVSTLDLNVDSIDLKIDRKSGTFSGKFRDPDDRETRVKFSGVLLQDEGRGVGLFEANTKTGHIEFEVKAEGDDNPTVPDDDSDNDDDSGDDDIQL